MAAEEDYSSDIVRLSFMDETLSHAGAEFSGEEEEGMDGMSLRLSAEQGDQPLLLFFNVPLHGHVNPTLDLVAELVKGGYRVRYYAEPKFKDLVLATGARFESYEKYCSVAFKAHRTESNIYNTAKEMIEAAELIVDGLIETLRKETIYAILYDVSAIWGKFLAEILKIPSVCCFPGLAPQWRFAFSSTNVVSRFMKDRYQGAEHLRKAKEVRGRLVAKYKMEEFSISMVFSGSPNYNFVFTSKEFQPFSESMDQTHFMFLGPSLSVRKSQSSDFPLDLLDQNKGRVVYISMGTLYHQDPKFFTFCFEAFKGTPYFVVMSVGRTTDISSLGEIPENVLVRGFVPQLEVLERTSVFVSHGGMNGISESIFYNVPMVLLPKTVEQELNASRMEILGAGLNLRGQEGLTKQVLLKGVKTVLTTNSYQKKTAEIKESFAKAAGVVAAVGMIDRLHTKKQKEKPIKNFTHFVAETSAGATNSLCDLFGIEHLTTPPSEKRVK
eukprot:CAMPEP_0201491494 /NCGR_PEP_ID=MMETSP0151_2-20130828/30045_1 /ASSEMBLY_ACC=CAM_ASM_000257 /TAXON_ID=200890 /ORGANISM="Paramoeba atlantica, Strain 621/1 / CCAP 1560/9" /LENGTH=496 /DNA_ID=CAMNT_0047877873 /DNA_START=65 /DNA_END=1555 /DNA_ORIENTATION=+